MDSWVYHRVTLAARRHVRCWPRRLADPRSTTRSRWHEIELEDPFVHLGAQLVSRSPPTMWPVTHHHRKTILAQALIRAA